MPSDPAPFDALSPADIEHLELFRRSPHPYHRRQHAERTKIAQSSESSTNSSLQPTLNSHGVTLSGEDGRKRRKLSESPSASGTEADDEGYGFVKALPAPPVRSRKGLRDSRGSGIDGIPSPLLTPSQVDDEGRRLSAEYCRLRKSKSGQPGPAEEEERTAREKYRRMRRNELFRRTTETVLLGVIGLLAIRGCCCWKQLLRWHRELLSYVFVVIGLLGLYPLRLLLYSSRRHRLPELVKTKWLRVPSAFDPATILYPTTLPVLISICLFPSLEKILLPNILLGLAAMPARLIPRGRSGPGYSELHWILSVIPLFVSEHTDVPSKLYATPPYKLKLPPPEHGPHPETLVTLFALQQALLAPLQYLTTTSLLPTELQLLSVGLINLLLFSESPQAVILQILLWVGGLGLFILCGKVLKWGVALARIPRWRFRHAGRLIKNRQSFLHALYKSKSRRRGNGRVISDSDADEDDVIIKPLKTKGSTLNLLSGARGTLTGAEDEPRSAVEPNHASLPDHPNGSLALSPPKRRNTLPTLPSQDRAPRRNRRHRSKSVAQSFLALTPQQAALRKWLYAGYFYLIVVAMILGPVRYLIGEYALHGQEPFGWAIGYLFGNYQPLRFQVFNWDLTSWIPLPPLADTSSPNAPLSQIILHPLNTLSSLPDATIRLILCAYCVLTITIGLATVLFLLPATVEVDTRRKVFHGTMVAMLLPTIYIDPAFISLALALVLAIFLLLDLIRASQLPPLSKPIALFLTPYVDGRDLRGPVVVSHIFLLIGCAIPLWLSLAGMPRAGEEPWKGWDVVGRDVSMVSGVVCVGMGDAAASLVGRRWGRRKWIWVGGKSLEGSAAFAAAVTLGLVFGRVWLRVGGWEDGVRSAECGVLFWVKVVGKAAFCALGASLNEAVLTGGNDNVVVPVLLWVLVKGVRL